MKTAVDHATFRSILEHGDKTDRAAVLVRKPRKKSIAELLHDINEEDKKVPLAIERILLNWRN